MTRYLEAIDSIERYVTNKKRIPAKSQKSISQEVFAAVAENKSPGRSLTSRFLYPARQENGRLFPALRV